MMSSKAEVRARALAYRDAVAVDVRQGFAARLAALGPDLVSDHGRARDRLAVALFHPIGSEPDLRPLLAALVAAGVLTALPVTPAPGLPLSFRAWRPGHPTVAGPFGLREPGPEAAALDPDVLFVPLAAFDRRGARIGYGKGYYDRTLAILRSRKPVRAIGVAYAVQEVASIAAEPHDQPLDLVVTERATLPCEA